MKKYYNYHKHSSYSNPVVQDSVARIEDYCERAKELGHDTIFTTEHGYQGSPLDYYDIAKGYGLNVIVGSEVYYDHEMSTEKKNRGKHLCIISLNNDGAKQLNKMLKGAWENFYYHPVVTHDMLFSLNPDNFVVTTACLGGMGMNMDFIKEANEYFKHFYLEVQNHDDENQKKLNRWLLKVSKEYGIPIIHGNDSHYISPEDAWDRNKYVISKRKGTNKKTSSDDDSLQNQEENFILDYPSYDTIIERYMKQGVLTREQAIEALENTNVFEQAEPLSYFNTEIKLPSIVDDPKAELRKIVNAQWNEKKKEIPKNLRKKYVKEIMSEMKTIEDTGMSSYFVIDYYTCKVAQEKYGGTLTKTGRGSAPSFYVNNLLNLTNIDRISAPITLFPSRFMSTTRILQTRSLPDIDLNTSDRVPFIKATEDLLGKENCGWMLAFKPLKDKQAFLRYCKMLDLPKGTYEDKTDSLDELEHDPKWKDIVEGSKKLIGVIESWSASPCSMCLFDKPVDEEFGVVNAKDKDKNTMQCVLLTGINCDKYKYLKNDYLSAISWAIIDSCYKLIGKPIPTIKELDELIKNDEKVWDIYKDGITSTINQADSDFGRMYAMRYKPHSISDMSAYVAILRPGCATFRDDFVDRKPYSTGIKELDDLLKEGSHRMIYQELIMKYLIWLSIVESETYTIIKKISKKKFKEKELKELKKTLSENWVKHIGTIKGFEETWGVVQAAAKYSFNASHSLSYAYDSVYMAYLKAHYPLEYYTVVFEYYEDDFDRTINLTKELPYFNIELKPVEFGKSRARYSCYKEENAIYKGVKSIKYLNEKSAEGLYKLSQEEEIDDFVDLLVKIDSPKYKQYSIDKRAMEILIRLNYFKKFGKSKYLLEVYSLYKKLSTRKTIKKAELEDGKIDIPEYLVQKYSEKETPKQFSKIDIIGLVKELTKRIENKNISIKEYIKAQNEYLGVVDYKNEKFNDRNNRYFIVLSDMENVKGNPKVKVHDLGEGITYEVRFRMFKRNPFSQYDFIIGSIVQEPKSKPVTVTVMVDGKEETKTDWIRDNDDLEYVMNDRWNIIQK